MHTRDAEGPPIGTCNRFAWLVMPHLPIRAPSARLIHMAYH